jgi:ubiquitin-protein ligase
MKEYNDPILKRLALDKFMLDELCDSSDLIEAIALNGSDNLPPTEYEIIYHVKSIIGIEDDKSPIYGDRHVAKISLPAGYPMVSPPSCYMLTDVWHPNIRFSGNLKGHICINAQVLGSWHTLDLLILQIGEMLQYKNYHALKIQPYPEDPIVAMWVQEYAEPRGLIDKSKFVPIDNRPLYKPSKTWLNSRKQTKINILDIRIRSANIDKTFEQKKPIHIKPK